MRTGGCVVAMGTFDGVHRGHRVVIKRAVSRARALGVPAVALTFRSPPRLFFKPRPDPQLLTLPQEKEDLLRRLGVDGVESLTFDAAMARQTASDFFHRRLKGRAREVVVGYDFAFGKGRTGDARFLEGMGLPVRVVSPVEGAGGPVSSGRIRAALKEGDLPLARRLLGRPYGVTAKVVRGAGRGRTLGFPTANLAVSPDKILPGGVFAVDVRLPDGSVKGGMANVGVRPTLKRRDPRPTLEVNLFDFKGSLPGKTLAVNFLKKLREEKRFSSLASLARQLHDDRRAALAAL